MKKYGPLQRQFSLLASFAHRMVISGRQAASLALRFEIEKLISPDLVLLNIVPRVSTTCKGPIAAVGRGPLLVAKLIDSDATTKGQG